MKAVQNILVCLSIGPEGKTSMQPSGWVQRLEYSHDPQEMDDGEVVIYGGHTVYGDLHLIVQENCYAS